jgi:pilus assembly protein CpaE
MMSGITLRTVIVDADPAARAAIRQALATMPSVTLVAEYDDANEAVLKAPSSRPDVMIVHVPVDAPDGDAASATTVERLIGRLPDTAILATANHSPAEFILRIIRAGAMEVVRRPVEARELVAAFEKVARLRGRPVRRQPGRVTAVFSSKGGLGATTLAVNLSVALAEHAPTKTTVLVELDTRHADVVTFLDLKPRYSILDVFERIDRMDEPLLQGLMVKHASGLWVLPGASSVERAYLGADQVQAGLDVLRGHFDHVVLDVRHDLDPGTIAALEAADTVLFLTSLNVSALRSAAASLAAFRHLGLDAKRVKVVVMRDDSGEDVTVKHVRETLGLPVFWKTPSEYATVVTSINNGRPVVTEAPRSKVAKNFRQLAESLIGDARAGKPSPARRSVSLLAAAWPLKHLSGA